VLPGRLAGPAACVGLAQPSKLLQAEVCLKCRRTFELSACGISAVVCVGAAWFAERNDKKNRCCRGREMRFARAIAACIALGAMLAACNPATDYSYFHQGIGTSLYRDDLPDVTRLQDLYLVYLCQQAGLAQPDETCTEMGSGQPAWRLVVQAGMNDIDLRCDSYLAWLDDKKRSTAPVLKELAALGGATAAILQAADAGPKSIALVGIAFGLAAQTFTNINSRLLQEVNHSTVQSVVLDNQQQFRTKVLRMLVDNKPAALYLLRSYLRICLPFSIETSINNTTTVFHRSGAEALREPLLVRAPELAPISPPSAPLVIRERPIVIPDVLPPARGPRPPGQQQVNIPQKQDVTPPGQEIKPLDKRPPDTRPGACVEAPDETARRLLEFVCPQGVIVNARRDELAKLLQTVQPDMAGRVMIVLSQARHADVRQRLLQQAIVAGLVAGDAGPGQPGTASRAPGSCVPAPDDAARRLLEFVCPQGVIVNARRDELARLLQAIQPDMAGQVMVVLSLARHADVRQSLLQQAIVAGLVAGDVRPGQPGTVSRAPGSCVAAPDDAARRLLEFVCPQGVIVNARRDELARLLQTVQPEIAAQVMVVLSVPRHAEVRQRLLQQAVGAGLIAGDARPGQPGTASGAPGSCVEAPDDTARRLLEFVCPQGVIVNARRDELAKLLQTIQRDMAGKITTVLSLPRHAALRQKLLQQAIAAGLIVGEGQAGQPDTATRAPGSCVTAPDDTARRLLEFVCPQGVIVNTRRDELAKLLQGIQPDMAGRVTTVLSLPRHATLRQKLLQQAISAGLIIRDAPAGSCVDALDEAARRLLEYVCPQGTIVSARRDDLARLLQTVQPDLAGRVMAVLSLPSHAALRQRLLDSARSIRLITQ